MQKELLKFTEVDKKYYIVKKAYEIILSTIILLFSSFFLLLFFIRKTLIKKSIFIRKDYFYTKDKNILLYFFNTDMRLIKFLPLFYFIFISKISLVGIALIEFEKNIKYSTNKKPGLFSLWDIRKKSKMPDISISSCNKEYEKNKKLKYDLQIIFKSIISFIYQNKNDNYFRRIKIFDIYFNNLKTKNIINFINSAIKSKMKKLIFFINADCMNKTYKNEEYINILNSSNLVLADGSGINIACNLLNKNLIENLNGTDLFPHICALAQKKSYKIFLFGAKQNICLKMKQNLEKVYPKLKIVGINHGYLKSIQEEKNLVNKINSLNTNILFVALGAPKQEIFINKYKKELNTNVILGVGGLFDFYSKKTKRAPLFLREIGFEWLFRIIQEPQRMWKRYIIGNPLFLYRILKQKKYENTLINSYLDNYSEKRGLRVKNILWKLNLFYKRFIKRVFDILVTSIVILLLLPLFIAITIIIKFTSKGEVFFVQKRVGIKGKIFKMYKFRSMIKNAHQRTKELEKYNEFDNAITFKIKEDPRITKFGSILRKTSIDELPQLFNVLLGDMSLVGPRPPLYSEVKKYSIDDKKRLDVKPGITCIWQVSGRSDIPFNKQVQMDKKYIKNQSLAQDIIILLKTIPAVLFQKGSY